eukprot:3128657-Pleurochrysis_carterae.AAC.2
MHRNFPRLELWWSCITRRLHTLQHHKVHAAPAARFLSDFALFASRAVVRRSVRQPRASQEKASLYRNCVEGLVRLKCMRHVVSGSCEYVHGQGWEARMCLAAKWQ